MHPVHAPSLLWRPLMLLALLFLSPLLSLHPAAAQTPPPSQVEVGAYIIRIAHVSQKEGTFDVDMWLWFRWKDDRIKPYDSFELSNGTIQSRSEAEVIEDGDAKYASVRVQATVFHDFDVSRYPLDSHTITINVEDQNLDAASLVYQADPNTAIDPDLIVPGWAVKLGPQTVQAHSYPSNYGLQSGGQAASVYSRLSIHVDLLRTDLGPLFKQFWISALSVLLGLLAFGVKATDLDARFGLGVASIFAASANAFVIADNLPQSIHVTLAEQINFLSVGTIFTCVAISVVSLRLCYRGHEAASERLDLWAALVVGMAYVLANLGIVLANL